MIKKRCLYGHEWITAKHYCCATAPTRDERCGQELRRVD